MCKLTATFDYYQIGPFPLLCPSPLLLSPLPPCPLRPPHPPSHLLLSPLPLLLSPLLPPPPLFSLFIYTYSCYMLSSIYITYTHIPATCYLVSTLLIHVFLLHVI